MLLVTLINSLEPSRSQHLSPWQLAPDVVFQHWFLHCYRKAFFEPDAYLIFSPKSGSRPAFLNSPDDVVWESPLELTTKTCLERCYQDFFPQFDNDRAHLADFFRVTLRIPNCELEHVLDEIRDLRDSETVDFDRTKELYAIIHDVYSAEAMAEVK